MEDEKEAKVDLDKPRSVVINLPGRVYRDLDTIARAESRTMTQLVREALGLRGIFHDEMSKGNKLVIINSKGKIVKEFFL